jgi:hypothetical protein
VLLSSCVSASHSLHHGLSSGEGTVQMQTQWPLSQRHSESFLQTQPVLGAVSWGDRSPSDVWSPSSQNHVKRGEEDHRAWFNGRW